MEKLTFEELFEMIADCERYKSNTTAIQAHQRLDTQIAQVFTELAKREMQLTDAQKQELLHWKRKKQKRM